MSVELRVPHVGESIYEVTIGEWFKAEGAFVRQDEPLVALETDKASLDVPAPASGVVTRLLKAPGDTAQIGEVLALIDASASPVPAGVVSVPVDPEKASTDVAIGSGSSPRPEPAGAPVRVMPAAGRLLQQHNLRPQDITPTGPGQRLLKEDVLRHIDMAEIVQAAPAASPGAAPGRAMTTPFVAQGIGGPVTPATPAVADIQEVPSGHRRREVIKMTPMRRRIAQRLVESQQTSASLTTFNEVDMSEIFALRKEFKASFLERHGAKLGFMSFFVKATIEALKEQPALNAEVRGDEIIYNHYYDIGVAIGGGRGLVVPVIRDAERKSFAEIEMAIRDFAIRAKKNKLRPDELQGGTFTISNGGVYGSMLSTPILNPPQVGILGMHNIQERAVVIDGRIEARPVMFIAMTYDHRIVDGREAVTFLNRIKECVENPSRILLEV